MIIGHILTDVFFVFLVQCLELFCCWRMTNFVFLCNHPNNQAVLLMVSELMIHSIDELCRLFIRDDCGLIEVQLPIAVVAAASWYVFQYDLRFGQPLALSILVEHVLYLTGAFVSDDVYSIFVVFMNSPRFNKRIQCFELMFICNLLAYPLGIVCELCDLAFAQFIFVTKFGSQRLFNFLVVGCFCFF